MASTRRDPSIDVIRGLCIASMVITHTSLHSLLHKASHAALWIDGATGFVLLAGLVIGMVQARAASTRQGLTKLARRTVLVYSAHLGLVGLALVLAPWNRMAPQSPPPAAALGGWPSAVWQAMTLRINPVGIYILSMYVVLFAVAAVAVVLLRHGYPWAVATASAAVYVVGLSTPTAWATLPGSPGVESSFDLAGWQALFVSGLLVGWYWRGARVAEAFGSRRVAVAAGIAVVVVCTAAQLVVRWRVLAPWEAVDHLVAQTFEKNIMGPGRLLLGWCAFTALYHLLRDGRWDRPQRLLAAVFGQVGRRSLDSYVLLSTAVVVLGAVAPYQKAGPLGMGWAVVVFVVIWLWAWLRNSAWWARSREAVGSRRAVARRQPTGTPAPSSASS